MMDIRSRGEADRLVRAVQMCRTVLSTEDVYDQLTGICREIRRNFGFSRVVIFLVDEVRSRVDGAAGSGLRISYIRRQSFPLENRKGIEISAAIPRCAILGRIIVCRKRGADAGYRAFLRGGAPPGRTFAKEYALLPLKARSRTFAVVAVSVMAGEGSLSDETIATLESFAEIVSLAILQARELQERKRLERQIENVGEEIQRRVGQDFHDGLGQDLTGIRMMAELLEEQLAGRGNPESGAAKKIAGLARRAVERARNLSRGLYPATLERHGLPDALAELAQHTESFYSVRCAVSVIRFPPDCPISTAIQIFRIAQESVHNAVKHGRARRIDMSLAREGKDRWILTITGDGHGWRQATDSGTTGLGLDIMRHRANLIDAVLRIYSARNRRTKVVCRFQIPRVEKKR